MPRATIDQMWPSWRYDPKTGEGAIYENEDAVPEGHVDCLSKVGKSKSEVDAEAKATAKETKAAANVFAKASKAAAKEVKKLNISLDTFSVTRAEAEALLTEESVEFTTYDTDDMIILLVKDLFEDDDSK